MIRKCPDCGEKRVAFSTRKTIGRFLHPILPFRAGRCVNCKRRRTDVNGWLLVVCLVAFFLIVTYVSIVVSGLSPKRQQMGGGVGDLRRRRIRLKSTSLPDERPLTVEVTRRLKGGCIQTREKSGTRGAYRGWCDLETIVIAAEKNGCRIQHLDADRWRAVFEQAYTSNTYSDVVTKELIWVQIDGEYRIAKEQVLTSETTRF